MPSEAQIKALSCLVQLQQQACLAGSEESLGFHIVNETYALIQYRQAVLWCGEENHPHLVAISGLPSFDMQSPFMQWLKKLCHWKHQQALVEPESFSAADIPKELQEHWLEWLPEHALWLPLYYQKRKIGALLLVRQEDWQEADHVLLAQLCPTYSTAWYVHLAKNKHQWRQVVHRLFGSKNKKWFVFILVFMLLWIPIRQSALAPAQVSALDAAVIRAPLDGVIDDVHVQPNQLVEKGALLFSLDDVEIRARLSIAVKEVAMLNARYQQAVQLSSRDVNQKSSMVILRAQASQKKSEVVFLKSMLQRLEIRATKAGIVIFSDPDSWMGRPVQTGERLLMVADAKQAEVKMQLAVGDSLTFENGSKVALFLNMYPLEAIPAELYYYSYQAISDENGMLSYELRAHFAAAVIPPRIGLRGTAKIYGKKVPIIYYLLRRPLAAARQWLGW
ncbi:MAG: HlyD family efflux transporter periplasmic adaptor subunit [Mariprofundaceae bacterium]|nr:HlyD family efflux transporter periplasmic adaptor subunit [Mariprofundaceae bacterium]